MELINDKLQRVSDKLQQLLKQYQLLQKENGRLQKEIESLKQKEEKQKLQAEELEQKVVLLKAAAGQMTAADKREMEKRLNFYIKEIDRCIALLSE